jgi:hypothetical protein
MHMSAALRSGWHPKKQVFDFAPPTFVCEQYVSELRRAKGEVCRLRSGELHRRACGSKEGASRRFLRHD